MATVLSYWCPLITHDLELQSGELEGLQFVFRWAVWIKETAQCLQLLNASEHLFKCRIDSIVLSDMVILEGETPPLYTQNGTQLTSKEISFH